MLDAVRPFFFGASLVALKKKSGGVRPITVGFTLHRLVAKIAGRMVVDDMAELLSPRQLGYGMRGGAEAAVHATRRYLMNLLSGHAQLKLDVKNAFNTVWRDEMLEAVQELAPDIYPLVHSAYSSSSPLSCGDKIIQLAKGVCSKGTLWAPFFFALPCIVIVGSFVLHLV